MKKVIRYIFLLSNVVSMYSLTPVTEKTFLSAPARTDFYFNIRDLWEQNLELQRRDDFGGKVLLQTSYGQSYNDGDLGRYFGINDQSSIVIGNRIGTGGAIVSPNVDIDKRHLILDSTVPLANTTINFKPQRDIFGLAVSYEQSLDKWIQGMSVRLTLPFEWVTHRLHPTICSDNVTVADELTRFFYGTFEHAFQQFLTKAKFSQKQSSSGISDIELEARYNLVNNQTFKLNIGLEGIIPTATKPSGEFLFEPLRGHAGHGGIGMHVHASHLLYDNFDTTLQLMGLLQARYFFSTKHTRTVSLKDHRFGHYFALGVSGETKVVPAANVLTMPLDVAGYTELRTSIALHGNHHGWFGLLAYHAKTREEEKLRLRCGWDNARYGVPNFNYTGVNPFGLDTDDFLSLTLNDWITTKDLDIQAAATPGFLLHEVSLALGKIIDFDAITLMLNAGFACEFSDRNVPAQSWLFSGNFGVSF